MSEESIIAQAADRVAEIEGHRHHVTGLSCLKLRDQARHLIETLIRYHNGKWEPTEGDQGWVWHLYNNRLVVATNPEGTYPMQHAQKTDIIFGVRDTLGIDLFRIAAGKDVRHDED